MSKYFYADLFRLINTIAFGVEAMVPAEANIYTLRRSLMPHHTEINEKMLIQALDTLEEERDRALLMIQNYQQLAARYYNQKVKERHFQVGDFVLRKVYENTKEQRAGKLGAKWEGPYKVTKVVKPGVYELESMKGKALPRSWNSASLKEYH